MQEILFKENYTSAENLIDDMFNAAKSSDDYLYRGISRAQQKYPNIMRIWAGGKYQALHYTKEIPMLKAFRKHTATLLGSTYNSIDFVSAAQHFGVPTRLLDWTENPFVALYFSLHAPISQDKNFAYRVFYCKKSDQIVLDDMYYFSKVKDERIINKDPLIQPYERFIEDIRDQDSLKKLLDAAGKNVPTARLDRFIVLQPNNSNPRVNAQQGVFVIPKTRSKTAIDNEYVAAGVQTIWLDNSVRDEALRLLENIGYSTLQLFFDLQNISSYIKEKALMSSDALKKLL